MNQSLKNFHERGYGLFPYIIIRWSPAQYQQIPIHRFGEVPETFEGFFISQEEISESGSYADACYDKFIWLWAMECANGNLLDMCLVTNAQQACFISKKGTINYGEVPTGGLLMDFNGKIIQLNRRHYLFDI